MMLRKNLDAVRERGPISRRITEPALRLGPRVGGLPLVALRESGFGRIQIAGGNQQTRLAGWLRLVCLGFPIAAEAKSRPAFPATEGLGFPLRIVATSRRSVLLKSGEEPGDAQPISPW